MKILYSILLLAIILSEFTSCKKPTSYDGGEYLGNWVALNDCPITSLTIYDDNTGCFSESDPWSNEGCWFQACGKVGIGPLRLYINSFALGIVHEPQYIDSAIGNYSGYYILKLRKPLYLDGKAAEITFVKYVF